MVYRVLNPKYPAGSQSPIKVELNKTTRHRSRAAGFIPAVTSPAARYPFDRYKCFGKGSLYYVSYSIRRLRTRGISRPESRYPKPDTPTLNLQFNSFLLRESKSKRERGGGLRRLR
jgi:hypothetical protein